MKFYCQDKKIFWFDFLFFAVVLTIAILIGGFNLVTILISFILSLIVLLVSVFNYTGYYFEVTNDYLKITEKKDKKQLFGEFNEVKFNVNEIVQLNLVEHEKEHFSLFIKTKNEEYSTPKDLLSKEQVLDIIRVFKTNIER